MKTSIVLIILILIAASSHKTFSQESVKDSLLKARNLIMQGQKEEANTILEKIMKSRPDNKQAVQFWLMGNMKRIPEGEMYALKQLDSLLVLYPKNTGIIFFKSFINAEHGKNEEALEGFNTLIELQPDSSLNYIGKGQVLSAMQKHDEAFAAFDKATVLAKLNRFNEALVAANKAIELAPDYPGNIYNRACIYCLMGDKTKALADLKTAVDKMPQLKQHATEDEDFKSLWEDEDFKELTRE